MEQAPNYAKGFNDGYKLARYSPHIYEMLKDSLSAESEYDQGLLAGAEQWQKEQEKQRLTELGEIERGDEYESTLERE